MQRLELTLPTPAENIALDEALLEWAEQENSERELLRLWESPMATVVVGRSSRLPLEVNEDVCREQDVAVVRRSSGGAAIVAAPGCLMYALILSYKLRPELKDIRRAHTDILNRFSRSLQQSLAGVGVVSQAGTSDLVFVPVTGACATQETSGPPTLRKFAGNSMRAKRTHLLYHGTLLYDFDLSSLERFLRQPPRQPNYRQERSHDDFVTNLPLTREALVKSIDHAWPTDSELDEWPGARVAELVAERFGEKKWNYEFP